MKNFNLKTILAALALLAGAAQGASIKGIIASTLTITGNNQLTGNVTCGVGANPCIAFGAAHTQLQLMGFTITGNAASLSTCVSQDGIDSGYDHAQIQGPGLITGFGGNGIILTGSNSEVQQVVITSVCSNGIIVQGSNNNVSQNSISRYCLNGGLFFAGIVVFGTGHHQIQQNAITGGGPAIQTGFGLADYGIFVIQGSDNNVIQQNNTSGNTVGIFINYSTTGSVGNMVRKNQALGNISLDIFDGNAAGANQYDQNLCQTSFNGVPLCPGTIPANIVGN